MKRRNENNAKKRGKNQRMKNCFVDKGIAAYKVRAACSQAELPLKAEFPIKAELPSKTKLSTKAKLSWKGTFCKELQENLIAKQLIGEMLHGSFTYKNLSKKIQE